MYMCDLSADDLEVKRVLVPLKLELQAAVSHPTWLLGIELQSSARAVSFFFCLFVF